MKMLETLYVSNRKEWRAWLEKNHASKKQILLIFWKRGLKPSIAYGDAVEQALCFGWIDSNIQKIDQDRYARKFTPRSETSRWSELNKRRVAKMVRAGILTRAGLAKINFALTNLHHQPYQPAKKKGLPVPAFMKRALLTNKRAWDNFNNLAPSNRRNYVLWVSTAKKAKTRAKRLEEAIQLLAKNQKLGMR